MARSSVHQRLTLATFAADMAAHSYLNFQYLFYSNTNYTYMRIDKAGQAGYLTAA